MIWQSVYVRTFRNERFVSKSFGLVQSVRGLLEMHCENGECNDLRNMEMSKVCVTPPQCKHDVRSSDESLSTAFTGSV